MDVSAPTPPSLLPAHLFRYHHLRTTSFAQPPGSTLIDPMLDFTQTHSCVTTLGAASDHWLFWRVQLLFTCVASVSCPCLHTATAALDLSLALAASPNPSSDPASPPARPPAPCCCLLRVLPCAGTASPIWL